MIAEAALALEQQLLLYMLFAIRPGAAFLAAPLFGRSSVPVLLRLVLAVAVGAAGIGTATLPLPEEGLVSVAGMLMIAGEVMAGLAMGFALQIGYAAGHMAGELIGNAMGLGFATLADPGGGQTGGAFGHLLSFIATFLFLAMGGPLALAAIVVGSFEALPVGGVRVSAEALAGFVEFAGLVFAAGASIAMPVAASLVILQIAMGMMARAAPTLNLIAVGLPATVLAGLILLIIAIPVMTEGIEAALLSSLDQARLLWGR